MITLSKGGKLTYSNRRGIVEVKDASLYLHEPIDFNGATVADLFKVITSRKIKSQFKRYYVDAFIRDSKKKPKGHIEKKESIEFYWYVCLEQGELKGLSFPSVHGIKTDSDSTFGLDFLSLSEIMHCKLSVNSNVRILSHLDESKAYPNVGQVTPTLGQVMQSLMWELSYHGRPSVRDAETRKMLKTKI